MSASNFILAVRTSPDTSQHTLFEGDNLANSLHGWFRHALNTSHDPQLCLPQLFEFLQHPGFIFCATSNVGATDHPAGPLQLLSMVYDPPSSEYPSSDYKPYWFQSATHPYPNLIEKATPLLPPLHHSEFALVFQTSAGELIVWHVRQEFNEMDVDPPPPFKQRWRAEGASSLQLRQDVHDHPLPVVPAYLCETINLGGSSAAFIVANDAELGNVPPLHVPVATLLQLFDNQPNLLPFLLALPHSFEVSISYCSQYNSNSIRRCNLRIETPGSSTDPFYIESTFAIPSTDIDGIPQILIHLKNFLSGYFQWQALQSFLKAQGYSMRAHGCRWELPRDDTTPLGQWYVHWLSAEPGGHARLPDDPTVIQRFGDHNGTRITPQVLPSPLEGLSYLWDPLQDHLQNLQQTQFLC